MSEYDENIDLINEMKIDLNHGVKMKDSWVVGVADEVRDLRGRLKSAERLAELADSKSIAQHYSYESERDSLKKELATVKESLAASEAVVENLKEHVEHVKVTLSNGAREHHCVGFDCSGCGASSAEGIIDDALSIKSNPKILDEIRAYVELRVWMDVEEYHTSNGIKYKQGESCRKVHDAAVGFAQRQIKRAKAAALESNK